MLIVKVVIVGVVAERRERVVEEGVVVGDEIGRAVVERGGGIVLAAVTIWQDLGLRVGEEPFDYAGVEQQLEME